MIQGIPVVDIFAGPGGLSEGFTAHRRTPGKAVRKSPFRVCLSIEKDAAAHATLQLRAFYRQFGEHPPKDYYLHLRGQLSLDSLYANWPKQAAAARTEAWHATLGEVDAYEVRSRINAAIAAERDWVLIGGPPCQAYSIVARSRRKKDEDFEQDEKHLLYREYLRIIADHRPPIFIMENVKGLLSASLSGRSTFERILADLQCPSRAVANRPTTGDNGNAEYHIYSLSTAAEIDGLFQAPDLNPKDYVIRCERYGAPQARHRVILLGVRTHLKVVPRTLAPKECRVSLWEAIGDLPKLRSVLSRCRDSGDTWMKIVKEAVDSGVLSVGEINKDLRLEMRQQARSIRRAPGAGGEFIEWAKRPRYARRWYYDAKLGGVCNHSARRHRADDIVRYFFVASFGRWCGSAPKLWDFPSALLPNHKNAKDAAQGSLFSDRFRVQVKGRPCTTITSHMCKDGHYFIHPDPKQCRSLTVREAARVQTFPDNYFFEGTRTEQYQQVGNAVPPLVAKQIAAVVYDLFRKVKALGRISSQRTEKLEHVAHSLEEH
jgi:DNA (cytosine-5)-methyltransferase 1